MFKLQDVSVVTAMTGQEGLAMVVSEIPVATENPSHETKETPKLLA